MILNNVVYLCELTVYHETNLEKSKQYKRNKYANIHSNLTGQFSCFNVSLHTIELSVFGFMSDCSLFFNSVTNLKLPASVYSSIIRSVICNSYNIYLNRNNDS